MLYTDKIVREMNESESVYKVAIIAAAARKGYRVAINEDSKVSARIYSDEAVNTLFARFEAYSLPVLFDKVANWLEAVEVS